VKADESEIRQRDARCCPVVVLRDGLLTGGLFEVLRAAEHPLRTLPEHDARMSDAMIGKRI
jgi:hypothetical protein